MRGWWGWWRRASAPAARTEEAALAVPRPVHRHRPILLPGTGGDTGPALRVLLFGSGPASGWGVQQPEEGLSGRLAVSLHERFGCAVEVVPVIDDHWEDRDPVAALRAARPATFDTVVAVSAYRSALLDLPLASWRQYLDELRDLLLVEAGPAGVIQVLALPWRDAVRRAPDHWGGAFGRQVVQLADAAADCVAEFRQIDLLELSAPRGPVEWRGPAFSPATYAAWGDEAAARIASRLLAPRCSGVAAD